MTTMAAAVGSSPKIVRTSPPSSDIRDHEKFCKHFFYKAAQIIVQSRLGEKCFFQSQPSTSSSSTWFNLPVKDIPEISSEARNVFMSVNSSSSSNNNNSIPFVVEISLKTMEGDSMVLETWTITMSPEPKDHNNKLNNAVYNHLGLLLKSLICVSRVIPSYRLSRRQGPETFVMCYRIFVGDSSSSNVLGPGFQSYVIGTVSSPVGSVSVKVDYRTEMTITPTHSISDVTQPIHVKADHFDIKPPPRTSHSSSQFKSSTDESSAMTSELTSDDSQDALRIFASSPPDAAATPKHRTTTTYSKKDTIEETNEKTRKTESSEDDEDDGGGGGGGEEDEEEEVLSNLKFGAFASSVIRKPSTMTAAPALSNDDDLEPLLNFLPNLSVDESAKDKEASSSKPSEVKVEKEEEEEEEQEEEEEEEVQKTQKNDDFVLLDTPFGGVASAAAAVPILATGSFAIGDGNTPAIGNKEDYRIFFELSGCPTGVGSGGGVFLSNIDEQLQTFEANLAEYDQMIKTLDTMASESETEGS